MIKRKLALLVAVIVLGGLAYLQFRTWRDFDWRVFASATRRVRVSYIAAAIGLTYFAYWLRAVRWAAFLKPVRRVPAHRLVAPQFIGFTGLALLGRPGELVRPYLIAQREGLPVSSQLAVWMVERICDLGGFAIFACIEIFAFAEQLPFSREVRKAGLLLAGVVLGLSLIAVLIRYSGDRIAEWTQVRLARFAPGIAASIAEKVREFRRGLNTIEDGYSLLRIAGLSLGMWAVIALVYRSVLHAYPNPALQALAMPQIALLMASSMLGSLIQLPGIGGGSQLAVITMLASSQWFDVPRELAVSSGILLWLVCFMAVVPVGIALARREHLLLRKVTGAGPRVLCC